MLLKQHKLIWFCLGLIIIVLSLPIYSDSVPVFFLTGLLGWVGDRNDISLLDTLIGRLYAILFFASNLALSLSGISLVFRKSMKVCLILLLLGLASFLVYHFSFISSLFAYHTLPIFH